VASRGEGTQVCELQAFGAALGLSESPVAHIPAGVPQQARADAWVVLAQHAAASLMVDMPKPP
jgi:hypothetical protein